MNDNSSINYSRFQVLHQRRLISQDSLQRLRHSGWSPQSPFLRRYLIFIHLLTGPILLFSFHSKEMKIRKAIFWRRRMSDVDGRSREPEHFVRFWIPVKMFSCTLCMSMNIPMQRKKLKCYKPVSGGSFSTWPSPPRTAIPPAALTIDRSSGTAR